MKEHKHAAILRAIADGKEVEYRIHAKDIWRLPIDFNPIAQQHLQWRIKPKPPIVKERFVSAAGNYGYEYVNIESSQYTNVRFTFNADTRLPIKVELI